MRLGMGSAAINDGSIDDVVGEAQRAADAGFDTFWASQIFGHDTLTVLAIVGREVPGIELGTAVVPTYPRHPMMMAQQALSVQAASGGRLCLGIGLSHKIVVESMWGIPFTKPVRHLREYLEVLMPLMEGSSVSHDGEDYRVHGAVNVVGGTRPTVLVAALGEQMLRVTGALADGTTTWCVGPKVLQDLTIPTIRQAAADAGRSAPRIHCTLPVLVTDDVDGARKRAATVFAVYDQLPSYKTMMDREGVAGPADLAIVGTAAEVRDQVAALADIGVTDFGAGLFASNPDEAAATVEALQAVRASSAPGFSVETLAGIATVTIDNGPVNLFDLELYQGLAALSHELAADDAVRVVVLRSANPDFFIAHFDVGLILRFPTDSPAPTELSPFHQMCENMRTMPKATIAVVEGRVGGGGSELLLSCDMRFAAVGKAVFNQPEVALGIIPGGSGTVRLGRLLGRSRALEVILGCDDVDAVTAEAWGWVNRALPPDDIWPFVDRLAARIASFPPNAVREAKASVLSVEKSIEEDLLAEAAAFNRTLGDPRAQRAMSQFMDTGGQTPTVELRLGEAAGELGEPST